jgi:hypothetical protein
VFHTRRMCRRDATHVQKRVGELGVECLAGKVDRPAGKGGTKGRPRTWSVVQTHVLECRFDGSRRACVSFSVVGDSP